MTSSSDSSVALPIRVYITRSNRNREAFATVWDSKHAMYIRSRLRLLGDFCGTLPKHIAQNQYLSLPLVLSYEETVFGAMKGFFTVVCDDDSDYAPQEEEQHTFWKRREDDIQRQVEESIAQQLAERERRKQQVSHDEELHSMQRARKRKREYTQEDDRSGPLRKMVRTVWRWIGERVGWTAPTTTTDETTALDATTAPETTHGEKTRRDDAEACAEDKEGEVRQRLAHQARATALVMTSTSARPDEGARRVRRKIRRPVGGRDKRLRERLCVLEDLYERGYFVSCGVKFGADFLAYAGSPQMFHAAAAVMVISAEQRVDARSIVAMGRLGDATKKRAVMAFVRDGAVRYVGVQWEETLP